MFLLLIGLVLFLGIHSTRIVAEEQRANFIRQRGKRAWMVLYSAMSLIGLLLIIYGYGQARLDPVVIWNPPAAMAHMTALLVLGAFVLLAAAYVPGNHLKARLGHPMVLGVKIWAVAHLLANGRLADMLLFGAFLAWAVVDFASCRRRDRAAAAAPGSGAGVATAPAASLSRDAITVAIGLVAWVIFALWLHKAWIGVAPFG